MLSGNLFYNTLNKPFSSHPFNSYLTTTYLVSSLFQCTQGEKIATTSISHNTQKLIDDKLGVKSHSRTVWAKSFTVAEAHTSWSNTAQCYLSTECVREKKKRSISKGVLHQLSRPRGDCSDVSVKIKTTWAFRWRNDCIHKKKWYYYSIVHTAKVQERGDSVSDVQKYE